MCLPSLVEVMTRGNLHRTRYIFTHSLSCTCSILWLHSELYKIILLTVWYCVQYIRYDDMSVKQGQCPPADASAGTYYSFLSVFSTQLLCACYSSVEQSMLFSKTLLYALQWTLQTTKSCQTLKLERAQNQLTCSMTCLKMLAGRSVQKRQIAKAPCTALVLVLPHVTCWIVMLNIVWRALMKICKQHCSILPAAERCTFQT